MSLPSGVLPWNSILGRVEGQNITYVDIREDKIDKKLKICKRLTFMSTLNWVNLKKKSRRFSVKSIYNFPDFIYPSNH